MEAKRHNPTGERDIDVWQTIRPAKSRKRTRAAGWRVGDFELEAAGEIDTRPGFGPHRLLARITRLSLHDLELAVGSPVFALLKSVSLSKQQS